METIKVKPWGEGQGEYVLINAEDFNAEIHEEFDVEPGVEPEVEPKRTRRRRSETGE